MDVTTGLRLTACGGILAVLIASTVLADEVTIESDSYRLNGDMVIADSQQLEGRVVLIVHGTLGHKDMEVIESLQSVFQESGQSSLAINLSLNMDDREGFYPCDALHTHEFNDAVDEIETWIRWLTGQGASQIVLLGHSRGANQVVKHVLQGVRSAQMAILLAPPATNAVASEGVLQAIDTGSIDDTLEGIDFLHCKNASVLASTYLSYYGPAADSDTIPLLQKVTVPTLVLSGSQDEVVPNLASRMSEIENPLVTHIEIYGADHFFRDLFMYDVVDYVIEFMGRQLSERLLIAPAASLQEDSKQSQLTGQPLLVFVSQKGCQFCKRLRKQVLFPMIRAGELDEKVILREVSLDTGYSLEDFAGVEIAGREFAARYNVFVTPTLLFLDGQGVSLVDPLVGTPNLEFYAFYLDKKIGAATEALETAQ